MRPEVRLEEVPGPAQIAPHSLAVSAHVLTLGSAAALASGRFVVLYDPAVPEAWESQWRVVSFARAELEPEFAADQMLGEVGWSWLTDALFRSRRPCRALGGTVTRVLSESFGALAEREPTVEIEIRASWSPVDDDLGEHLRLWTDVLCSIAGLPPLPDGVTPLPGQRW